MISTSIPSFSLGDPEATTYFALNGWVLIDTLSQAQVTQLSGWIHELSRWPDVGGDWLHYREMTDHGPRLCRTENFVPFHAGLRELLTSGPLLETASALLGQPGVLYKEKVNYKLAGGAGYAAHQDAPAYPFISTHISCLVAVDNADLLNGCLEVVSGTHHHLIEPDSVGCIPFTVANSLNWMPAPTGAGQTLWFHSLTPHRSGANTSTTDRRGLYPTYNALAEGDLRHAYYREKLSRMANTTVGDNVQVSLIGDFQGRPI